MKHTASEGGTSKSSASSTSRRPAARWAGAKFALCVQTSGTIDLEPRRLYQVRGDKKALAQGFIRVVDESGEDYLYPAAYFWPIRIPGGAAKALKALS